MKPNNINKKAKIITDALGLSNRVQRLKESNSYIQIKDHKEDFQSNPKFRLINGTNQDISRIAQKSLKNLIRRIKVSMGFELWENTQDALNWFQKVRTHIKPMCEHCEYPSSHMERVHDNIKDF